MGYRLNRLDEPVFIAVSKPLLTEFGIHYKLESCVWLQLQKERLACKLVVFCQPEGMLLEARVLPRFDQKIDKIFLE